MVRLTEWLRNFNNGLEAPARIGFYGLDLYRLFASIEEVLRYLDAVDPAAAQEARARYVCFDHYDEDSQAYGYAAGFGMFDSWQNGVVAQLMQLRQRSAVHGRRRFRQRRRLFPRPAECATGDERGGILPHYVPCSRLVPNLRDRHRADTLDALIGHLDPGSAGAGGAGGPAGAAAAHPGGTASATAAVHTAGPAGATAAAHPGGPASPANIVGP